tara:strand:+ start:277 stop:777 length:501 start_codon:yes stop_codon:yes gene_type:complete
MKSSTSTHIKKREKPNDIFITPLKLAKKQIDMIDYKHNDIWFDPFKNDGSFYNQYPTDKKDWCEILEGKDFFEYDKPVDIICSNPPYSCIDDVLLQSVKLKPRVISYLIGMGNLTAKRIEFMENNGYGLTKLHMCKVFKWYGMSFIVQFEKGGDHIISYDRIVWKI